ncbi:hypothetical protein H072_7631 [Dactylellina haptotyla CBS 200.50]|uniref:Alcohol dehydrogenase-like C-terminal domain-containing protein n=1 Tax=Dactylellina haptotyla (strain CBS 200.50) TaxID=1284197 RepID=S8ABX6_DACHA|nr:hypothetical protein H072_7631 [Dactylellina haptotyla CBS 200.50]
MANKSVVIHEKGDAFRWTVEDKPIPEASTGSIIVKILVSPLVQFLGAHYRGTLPFMNDVPMVPGMNAVGRVHATGNDATALQEGDLVILDPTITARDEPANQMLHAFMPGITPGSHKLANGAWRDGVWAQYAKIPTENVYKLNEEKLVKELGYSFGDLGLIQTCCVGYGGLAKAGLKAGDTLIVAPATGRFSGATVLVALAMGVTVVAAGRRQEALDELVAGMKEYASFLKTVLLTGELVKDTESFNKAVGPRGADSYIDLSPAAITETPVYLTAAISTLRHSGTIILMGGVLGDISLPYFPIMFKNLTVYGRFMYSRDQMIQVIKLAESGRLPLGKRCGIQGVADFGLDRFEEALDEAAKHKGWGGVVNITPN